MLQRLLVIAVVLLLCEQTSGLMNALHAAPHARLLGTTFDPAFVGSDGGTFSYVFLPSGTPVGGAVFRVQQGQYSVQASDRESHLTELVRTGIAAPGTPDGVVFEFFVGSIAAGARGAGFIGLLNGPDVDETNNHGLWRIDEAGVHKVMRVGDPVPGLGDATFFAPMFNQDELRWGFSSQVYTINPNGAIGFQANLIGSGARDGNDRALFVGDSDGLRIASRRGDPAPGAGAGATFGVFYQDRRAPILNRRGEIAFNASIDGGTSAEGIFAELGAAGLQPIALAGEPAPQAGDGVVYEHLSTPSFNDARETAFWAYLSGPSVSDANNLAIFAGARDTMRMVAREGAAAPGTDAYFGKFDFRVPSWTLGGSGHVAFVASLTGPSVNEYNDSGVWVRDAEGELRLVAREGDSAPGGGAFIEFGDPLFDFRLHINSAGQVAFFGRTDAEAEYPGTSNGIWATDRAGELHLIAGSTQPFEFESPTGVETVTLDNVYLPGTSGGQDGFAINLNDRGEIVFLALHDRYTHSVFVSYAVAVPEPKSLRLLGFAVVGLIGRFHGVGRRRLLER